MIEYIIMYEMDGHLFVSSTSVNVAGTASLSCVSSESTTTEVTEYEY